MKILTDDHWELIVQQLEKAQARVKELEGQNIALLDRLLIHNGQMPTDMGTVQMVKEDNKAHEDLMNTLLAEEIGEEPKDDVEST